MRVTILGGTHFIGRAISETLLADGHDLTVVHRGLAEPESLGAATHIHTDRADLALVRDQIADCRPEVVIDTIAMTRASAQAALEVIPAGSAAIVLSSQDVYEAYGDLNNGRSAQTVPIDETSPVRAERYPYRDHPLDMPDYDKLDVEDLYLPAGALSIRLPAVYGPHDGQRREEFVLRRVRAGRAEIPFGAGNWLWSRIHVADAATAVVAAAHRLAGGGRAADALRGRVLNVCQPETLTMWRYAEAILAGAQSDARLVRVPDAELPPDLGMTGALPQHLLVSPFEARRLLAWAAGDQHDRIADSVQWHLANPPSDGQGTADDEASDTPGDDDPWAADDAALAAAPQAQS